MCREKLNPLPLCVLILAVLIPSCYGLTFEQASKDGPKMLSTSTPAPESLTTPKDPAAVRASMKQELLDFLTLSTSLKSLKDLADILTESNLTKGMEQELQSLLDIVLIMDEVYGFRAEDDFARTCSYDYTKEKKILLQEFETLYTNCKDTLDNVDVLHFSKTEAINKLTIHACSERAKTIPIDVMKLVDHSYQASLICALESVKDVMKELKISNFFSRVNENSMLLIKELNYILMDADKVKNHTERNMMQARRNESVRVKQLVESELLTRTIKNFTTTINHLFKDPNPNTTTTKSGFIDFAQRIKEQLYERYLKVYVPDSLENWGDSPGLYKILYLNNLLREMIAELTFRNSTTSGLSDTQQDLATAKLYMDTSPTYGKACENSPNHLVGTCTPENHEVCRHVVMNWGAGGDQELLRNDELMLLGSLTHLKHCACGFRTDCDGARKVGRTTCFLMPNPEGQCRGGEGYPCYTHPLEPGMYDESCITGYCNRKTNSCEFVEPDKKEQISTKENLQRLTRTMKQKLKNFVGYFG